MNYLFYDIGVTSNNNPQWSNVQNRLTVKVSNEGTELTTNARWGQLYPINQTNLYTTPFYIEFNIVGFSNHPCIRVHNGSETNYFELMWIGHYKIILAPTGVVVKVNGEVKPNSINIDLSNSAKVYFELPLIEDILKYNNFRLYQ